MHSVVITGTGLHQPPYTITNAELVESFNRYVAQENEPSARKKSEKVLGDAQSHGADLIVTACPLCRYNLSKYSADVPVVYFTELLAQALGVEEEA